MLIRYQVPDTGEMKVRLGEAFEIMRMIGWDDSMYTDHGPPNDMTAPDYIALLINMAGNAWSMFHSHLHGR